MVVLPRTIILTGPRRNTHYRELVISASYRRLRESLASAARVWVVTRVAGFIGSNLLEDLRSLGQTVIGVDNFSTGHRANVDDVLRGPLEPRARFRMVEADIRELDTCRTACAGADPAYPQIEHTLGRPLSLYAMSFASCTTQRSILE